MHPTPTNPGCYSVCYVNDKLYGTCVNLMYLCVSVKWKVLLNLILLCFYLWIKISAGCVVGGEICDVQWVVYHQTRKMINYFPPNNISYSFYKAAKYSLVTLMPWNNISTPIVRRNHYHWGHPVVGRNHYHRGHPVVVMRSKKTRPRFIWPA